MLLLLLSLPGLFGVDGVVGVLVASIARGRFAADLDLGRRLLLLCEVNGVDTSAADNAASDVALEFVLLFLFYFFILANFFFLIIIFFGDS